MWEGLGWAVPAWSLHTVVIGQWLDLGWGGEKGAGAGASRQLSPHELSVALFGPLELSQIISPKVPRLPVQVQHECFRALARS